MKHHVCPKKWTVKVMGIYLTNVTILVWGKKHTQSALAAKIKNNKTKHKYKEYPVCHSHRNSAKGITDQQGCNSVNFKWSGFFKMDGKQELQNIAPVKHPPTLKVSQKKERKRKELKILQNWGVPGGWVHALAYFFSLNEELVSPPSGLHLQEALELEGHNFPVVTGADRERHPVTRGFGQNTGWRWLTEFRPCIAWAALGCQECVEMRHCTLPVLIIVGGKTDRSILLCRHGLPCLWRPVVGSAFLAPSVAVVVKAPCPPYGCSCSVLVTASLLCPAKLVVLLGQRALRVGNWNVVPLSTSHTAFALRVT